MTIFFSIRLRRENIGYFTVASLLVSIDERGRKEREIDTLILFASQSTKQLKERKSFSVCSGHKKRLEFHLEQSKVFFQSSLENQV